MSNSVDPDGEPIAIIGAGPAGLTAAVALLERGFKPIVFEMDSQVGGISKTFVHNGNRLDIGGHRFFSKDDDVMKWWLSVLPLQGTPSSDDTRLSRSVSLSDALDAPDPEQVSDVMLSRSRLSRIYFLRRFFDYPISLSASTLKNLGMVRTVKIGLSYIGARVRPIRPETSLEAFMINRFGRELYELFFKDYTEKVWGVPCESIGSEWGAQRIRGISVAAILKHALASMFRHDDSISQDGTQTSLINRFLYPKLGPGQLWEAVARRAEEGGATIRLGAEVTAIEFEGERVGALRIRDRITGVEERIACSSVLSSMPVRDFVQRCEGLAVPADVRRVADGLPYRDFITCGLLVSRLLTTNPDGTPILDNWIYIQEREVRLGRLQIFNNWSPYLVANADAIWLGLEYFCEEGDDMWAKSDVDFAASAAQELETIGLINSGDVLDHVVLRIPKAYPAYFGTHRQFDVIRQWLDKLPNAWVMGRNGMHRYNNMDHSMLSAWAAVDAVTGGGSREAIWDVNADDEYQETK